MLVSHAGQSTYSYRLPTQLNQTLSHIAELEKWRVAKISTHLNASAHGYLRRSASGAPPNAANDARGKESSIAFMRGSKSGELETPFAWERPAIDVGECPLSFTDFHWVAELRAGRERG